MNNKKHLLLPILILLMISPQVFADEAKKTDDKSLSAAELSNMSTEELKGWLTDAEDVNIDWEYIKTCNRYLWDSADLNNDGAYEYIGVFFQWDGEGVWSNDIGYVICIFDDRLNILFGEEIIRYAFAEKLSVEDIDNDGFKEAVVVSEYIESFPDKTATCIYGWDGEKYVKEKVIKEKR